MKLADLPLEGARFDPRFAGYASSPAITADSRKVKPGYLFAALPGTKSRRPRFRAGGGRRPAPSRCWPHAAPTSCRRRSPSSRSPMRAARWRWPRPPSFRASRRSSPPSPAPTARPPSPPSCARSGPRSASPRPASAPSAWCRRSGAVYGSHTTPDPVELHRTLDRLAGEGVTHLAMEASTHGLDQHRLDGVRVAAGAFTNSPAIISIITRPSRPISPPSCGCSRR